MPKDLKQSLWHGAEKGEKCRTAKTSRKQFIDAYFVLYGMKNSEDI